MKWSTVTTGFKGPLQAHFHRDSLTPLKEYSTKTRGFKLLKRATIISELVLANSLFSCRRTSERTNNNWWLSENDP